MPSKPTPQANPLTLDLSGAWHLKLDPTDAGIREEWFKQSLSGHSIQLPGSIDAQGLGDPVTLDTEWTGTIFDRSFYESEAYAPCREAGNIKVPFFLQPETHYLGSAWYQASFRLPDTWTNQSLRLFLERPHWHTRLWINDREIGEGDSLSTPHTWDLGPLEPSQTHRLSLRVDNRLHIEVGENAHSVSDHTQGNWNGVIGRIELKAQDACEINQLDVFPDVETRSIRVLGALSGVNDCESINLKVLPKCEELANELARQTIPLEWSNGTTSFDTRIELGPDARLWDEFDPALYELEADCGHSRKSTTFGLRAITRNGSQLAINGRKVFLRGTLDCCIFPLTGHPPMDVESWHSILNQIKNHGLNHVRFHSWCPPEAAFIAGDELGLYFQVECPIWPNAVAVLAFNSPAGIGDGKAIDQWAYTESERILQAYGNHPCFVLMACGNEPGGPQHREYLSQWLLHFRKRDHRRLYTASAGWPELEESDFHVPSEPRLHQWGEGLDSRLNAQPPSTTHDYAAHIAKRDAPVVSHEIGQWCAYPPIYDTDKYQGHLKPRINEIVADSLKSNHMADQIRSFVQASGKLQALCYKEEIEASLRTRGQAGFQLLGLQDFPGQQTAPVGMLDAFWQSKGYLEAAQMRGFCNATVPLLRLEKRVYDTSESMDVPVEVAHFGPQNIQSVKIHWQLSIGENIVREGKLKKQDITTGNLNACGTIQLDWNNLNAPSKYTLTVRVLDKGNTFSNTWDLWLYPADLDTAETESLQLSTTLADALQRLESGQTVLLIPKREQVKGQVELGFSSIFWNTACTQGQPPHTLGILCNPDHPALQQFPTDFHSNWQWWYPIQSAAAMVLDPLPPTCRPIVQVIDDWFKNRRLGLLFEARVGNGKLLVCSIDLLSQTHNPEQNLVNRQLLHSLTQYLLSPQFDPEETIQATQLESILD